MIDANLRLIMERWILFQNEVRKSGENAMKILYWRL
jgi:hypothetical protein